MSRRVDYINTYGTGKRRPMFEDGGEIPMEGGMPMEGDMPTEGGEGEDPMAQMDDAVQQFAEIYNQGDMEEAKEVAFSILEGVASAMGMIKRQEEGEEMPVEGEEPMPESTEGSGGGIPMNRNGGKIDYDRPMTATEKMARARAQRGY